MALGALMGALGAAVCYGIGSVLQAVGARRTAGAAHLDPHLLVRLAGQLPFAAGILLDVAGAGLSIVALRTLPLFVVQAAIASSLGVTALVAARVFHTGLGRRERLGIAAVGTGLVVLAAASGREGVARTELSVRLGLFLTTLLVGVLAVGAGRLRGTTAATVLGALAGVGYGVANTSVRVIHDLGPSALVTDPAAWAAVIGAVSGVLFFATALQRGAVTTATAALIAAETLLPALFGLVVLGERPRQGLEVLAACGFAITVAGAVTLSRFGEAPLPTLPTR